MHETIKTQTQSSSKKEALFADNGDISRLVGLRPTRQPKEHAFSRTPQTYTQKY
jgi:hypothetical protein